MNPKTLFCSLTSERIAALIGTAQQSVCYAGPGIRAEVALATVKSAARLGPEAVTICLDFDERVMRMGYGEIEAIRVLRDAGIIVRSARGLRTALVIVDHTGFIFTPTALYLEPEPEAGAVSNAVRMSEEQMAEALSRLSPAAKAIAMAQARTPEDKARIEALPVEVSSLPVTDAQFSEASTNLTKAPPVRFDLARQVRVFEPYLQYVELSLTGAAIQRHRLSIPTSVQKLGGSEELEKRLRTTFELIEKGSKLSSKPLEDELNELRKNFTPSLGKDHGRVVLKSAKPHLVERLAKFRKRLESHQANVAAELQKHLDQSREQVVAYYLPRVISSTPDALLGQLLSASPSEKEARQWLTSELAAVFPKAKTLIAEMKLSEHYKDVTFETLNRDDFLASVKIAFPNVDWDKTYEEFKAAGEQSSSKAKSQ